MIIIKLDHDLPDNKMEENVPIKVVAVVPVIFIEVEMVVHVKEMQIQRRMVHKVQVVEVDFLGVMVVEVPKVRFTYI